MMILHYDQFNKFLTIQVGDSLQIQVQVTMQYALIGMLNILARQITGNPVVRQIILCLQNHMQV